MNQLCFADKKGKSGLSFLGSLYLIPFHRHTLLCIKLKQNLLRRYFVGKLLKHEFSLIKLCNACKLNEPKQQVQYEGNRSARDPPMIWNPEISSADGQINAKYPPLLFQYRFESYAYICLCWELIFFSPYYHLSLLINLTPRI